MSQRTSWWHPTARKKNFTRSKIYFLKDIFKEIILFEDIPLEQWFPNGVPLRYSGVL